jgi:NADH-quinone oxidoreductase subunit A
MNFADINHNANLIEYLPIIIFIIVSLCLVLTIVFTSMWVAPSNTYFNKITQYESGFNAFQNTKRQINIKFYLVAILFLIFDIEILFIYPWAMAFYSLSTYGFYSMMIFFIMLLIGFIYEWKKGALSWT